MPPNSTYQVVALTAGTPEYTEVVNMFTATCRRTVLKVIYCQGKGLDGAFLRRLTLAFLLSQIERIQNVVLWRSLQVKKHDMELRNGHDRNETRLFHGTCASTVPLINKHGFNRSFAGKNGEKM